MNDSENSIVDPQPAKLTVDNSPSLSAGDEDFPPAAASASTDTVSVDKDSNSTPHPNQDDHSVETPAKIPDDLAEVVAGVRGDAEGAEADPPQPVDEEGPSGPTEVLARAPGRKDGARFAGGEKDADDAVEDDAPHEALAELSSEVDSLDDRVGDGDSAGTPAPRLVVIAENIDSAAGEDEEEARREEPEATEERKEEEKERASHEEKSEDSRSSSTAIIPDPSRQGSDVDRKASARAQSLPKTYPSLVVRCTNVALDGHSIRFALHSRREATGEDFVVDRSFEDFEWLHDCMTTTNDFPGLIFPPLPRKPNSERLNQDSQGNSRRSSIDKVPSPDSSLPSLVMSSDRRLPADCRVFQTYLNLILSHPVLADDSTLVKFVTEPNSVPRVRLKKGLLFKISFAVDSSFGGSRDYYPDSDNYFQQERDWLSMYLPRLLQLGSDCDRMLQSELKISKAFDHLSTTLRILVNAPNGDRLVAYNNKLLHKFICTADKMSEITERLCFENEESIFLTLSVFGKYMEASKEMMQKRIGLLADYNDAVNRVTSAKPTKKKAAEEAMIAAEKAFADCTIVAKKELRHLRASRIASLKSALVSMATVRRDESQRAVDTLSEIHASMVAFEPIPTSP